MAGDPTVDVGLSVTSREHVGAAASDRRRVNARALNHLTLAQIFHVHVVVEPIARTFAAIT